MILSPDSDLLLPPSLPFFFSLPLSFSLCLIFTWKQWHCARTYYFHPLFAVQESPRTLHLHAHSHCWQPGQQPAQQFSVLPQCVLNRATSSKNVVWVQWLPSTVMAGELAHSRLGVRRQWVISQWVAVFRDEKERGLFSARARGRLECLPHTPEECSYNQPWCVHILKPGLQT